MSDVPNPFQLKLATQEAAQSTKIGDFGFIERDGVLIVDDPNAGRSNADLMVRLTSKKSATP